MNPSTNYHADERNPWVKIVTVLAAIAAAAMILAGVAAEMFSRGISLQSGAAQPPAACTAVTDVTMPPEIRPALHAECAK